MANIRREFETTDNRSVLKKTARKVIAREARKCDRCPPHSGENLPLHRVRPDKYKKHR